MSSEPHASIRVRPATAADEPALVELARRLTSFDLPPWRKPEDIATADAREMLDAVRASEPDNEVLIAQGVQGVQEVHGVHGVHTVVGCLHILATTDFFGTRHAHISVLATTKAAEGTGVGRALLAHAEAWAVRRGLTMLTLNVFVANGRARRFYERAGMVPEMMKYVKPLEAGTSADVENGPAAPTY